MSEAWTEDQADLLKFSLHNIFETVTNIPRYKSNKFYLAIPIDRGYRFFDIEGDSLEEMVFKATELLQSKNIDRLNLETADGLPILTIYLEEGPTVIIDDFVTGKAICNIVL
ncbi:MAG: hypothetical protein JSV04_04215 [Candidatus Heimdallarchaeota archaeon]|nr:MAG: hypothetical protein JSV04_04215 [Candidatus Heimdallarchaeota archaeon]